MADPWTQTLELGWRPSLKFYENRVAILSELDERRMLREFAVQESHIGARLIPAGTQLAVRPDRLTVGVLTQKSDLEPAKRSVEIALGKLGDLSIYWWSARFQFVIPLDSSFEAMVEAGVRTLVPVLPSGVGPTDWATVLDLAGDGMTGHAEYGIIRASEAVDRLTGVVGRSDQSDWGAESFTDLELPDVALFLDCRWAASWAGGAADEIWNYWSAARELSAGVADTLNTALQ